MKHLSVSTLAFIFAVLQIFAHPYMVYGNTTTGDIKDTTEYTIMFYGDGGDGDLDSNIIANIKQIYKAKNISHKNVKVAIQYRFSRSAKLKDKKVFNETDSLKNEKKCNRYGSASCRFVLDKQKTFDFQIIGSRFGRNLDIDNPKHLTDFINWAKNECPAKHYVLILAGHGNGYVPHYNIPYSQQPPKSDIDKDLSRLSLISMVEGVRATGMHFDIIYWDACLMNTLECIYEQKDLADYLIVSTFNVPGKGGDYTTFINQLGSNIADATHLADTSFGNNESIEKALKKFCKATIAGWDNEKITYSDISVIKTSRLDYLGKVLARFTDKLIDAYQNGGEKVKQTIDKICRDNMWKVNARYPYYSFRIFTDYLSIKLPEYFPKAHHIQLISAMDYCFVSQEYSRNLRKNETTTGCSVLQCTKGYYTELTWTTWGEPYDASKHHFTISDDCMTFRFFNQQGDSCVGGTSVSKEEIFYNDGKCITIKNMKTDKTTKESNWGSSFNDTYKTLVFDKITGWSRWLEINDAPSLAFYSMNDVFKKGLKFYDYKKIEKAAEQGSTDAKYMLDWCTWKRYLKEKENN